MTLRGDDDDTSRGRITQGGHRDSGSAGPARSSGDSFWWFALALIVAAVVAVAWIGSGSRRSAPRANSPTLSTRLGPDAGRPAGEAASPPASAVR